MKKGVGYIVSLVGLGILLLGVKPINEKVSLPFLSGISNNILLIVGIVVLSVGVILARSAAFGSGKQPTEVPIYHGKNVVGYRRMK